MATLTDIIAQTKSSALAKLAASNSAQQVNKLQLALDTQLLQNQTNLEPLVKQLYVAYFGRPATDNEIKQWWAPSPIDAAAVLNPNATENPLILPSKDPNTPTGVLNYLGRGGNIETMAQYLANQSEYLANLGPDPLGTLFLRLFGRLPVAEERQTLAPAVADPLLPLHLIQKPNPWDAAVFAQKVDLAYRIKADLAAGLGANAYPDATVDQPAIADAIRWAVQLLSPQGATLEEAYLDFRHLLDPNSLTPLEQLRLPATDAQYRDTIHTLFLAYLGRPPQTWDADNDPDTPLPGYGSEFAAAYAALKRANGDPTYLAEALSQYPDHLMRLTEGGGPAAEIRLAYQTLYNRQPSASELQYWLQNFSGVTPWQIATQNPYATASDQATLNQKIAFIAAAGSLYQQKGLDPAAPLQAQPLTATLKEVGTTFTALNGLNQLNATLGQPETGMAAIVEVFLNGAEKTLTLTFSEPINWNATDRNGNGQIELGSDIQITLEARYRKGAVPGDEGGAFTNDPVPLPLGSKPTVAKAEDYRLTLALSSDAGLLKTRTVAVDHDNNPATPDVNRTDTPFPYTITLTGLTDVSGDSQPIQWTAA